MDGQAQPAFCLMMGTGKHVPMVNSCQDNLTETRSGLAMPLLELFRTRSFSYTLRPPLLGANSIDEFLFSTRQGFCSHYAGAFVFVMRAAGIPARVVAGYQGGEYKPADRVIQVRQFDAHAWAEIWVPESGWVRVDPAAAVSPERIREGLEKAVAGEGSFFERTFFFSTARFRHVALLNKMRLSLGKARIPVAAQGAGL